VYTGCLFWQEKIGINKMHTLFTTIKGNNPLLEKMRVSVEAVGRSLEDVEAIHCEAETERDYEAEKTDTSGYACYKTTGKIRYDFSFSDGYVHKMEVQW
jgi:hypothetical protein